MNKIVATYIVDYTFYEGTHVEMSELLKLHQLDSANGYVIEFRNGDLKKIDTEKALKLIQKAI